MGEINLKAENNWKPPSQMDHTLKQNLIEGGGGWGGLFLSLESQTVKTGHRMLVHFSTFIHLMVTIETDDQTGLVATIAVSVAK